jgi:hypothetical protein
MLPPPRDIFRELAWCLLIAGGLAAFYFLFRSD